MNKILVTGADGQLGYTLQVLSGQYKQYKWQFTDVASLDITDKKAIDSWFAKHQPDICINCAAYTKVDQAEQEPETARLINATAVEFLADACEQYNTRLIHISTDFVFDGLQSHPYATTDTPHPIGAYARTKWEGEQKALVWKRAIVVRTAWVYSPYGQNFMRTMLRLGAERDELRVVSDQVGSPTSTVDLAKALLALVAAGEEVEGKVFHYSNEGVASWYDFAKAIIDIKNLPCRVTPISTREYPTPAKRPAYSVLDKSAIKAALHIEIPHWRDSLRQVLQQV
jgi:dTDP-4-dehydrorhamnose reductase